MNQINPNGLKDIQTRADVEFLLDSFYKQVIVDDLIGFIFTEVVLLDWTIHMAIMYNFWESILLDKPVYKGNPMLKHLELNKKTPLLPAHFDRWLELWEGAVYGLFNGDVADEAIKRAKLMAGLMQHKIKMSASDNFIQ